MNFNFYVYNMILQLKEYSMLHCLQDKKIQNLLGHFYKKFQGEINLKNLGKRIKNCQPVCSAEVIDVVLAYVKKSLCSQYIGSLYGGHGSFLPAHPRSPLAFPQCRIPADPPNHGSASRSPYLPTEVHFYKAYTC